MRHFVSVFTLTTLGGLFSLSACGDGSDGGGPGDGDQSTGASNSGGDGDLSFGGSLGPGLGFAGNPSISYGDGDGDSGGDGDDFKECASDSAESALEPVYLVFLLDQSGSMGDGEHGDRTEKWDPVTEALEAFFADPESAGLYASLSLFPDDVNQTTAAASNSYPISCDAADYGMPVVEPQPLPNDTTFSEAIAAVDPPNEFGTPTAPALTGTVAYAQSLADEGRKVAIVMVTDGEPAQCSDSNSVENTAAAAAAVVDTIPTYVIGVGNALDSLNAIAVAGGTESAFIVDTNNPEQTRNDLLGQVQQIRGEQISCDLSIPKPPKGQTLDPNKVNVELSAGDEEGALSYNEECEDGVGWHYDDAKDPSYIELCDKTCDMVKSSDDATVNVVFGCETRTLEIR